MHMAQTLGSFELGVPEVEKEDRAQQVLVMVEDEQNDKKGVLPEEFEDLSNFVLGRIQICTWRLEFLSRQRQLVLTTK
jgi:hypothetical protein